jgi:uncharacterized membrane protein YhaH (DUF805 family)
MENQESNYNLIDWWKKVVFNNYANFTGRARRAEYWYFVLGNFLVIIPFYILAIVGLSTDNGALSTLGFAVYGIVILVTLVPTLAVAVRRLHDLNKSGWYYFIGLIPIIGSIILLVWFFTDGNRFTNNYGPDPKNLNETEFDFEKPENLLQQ